MAGPMHGPAGRTGARPKNTKKTLFRIFGYLKPYRARLTLVGRFSPAALEAVFHALARAEVFPRLIELDAAHAALRLALPEDRLEAAVRALGRADPI